MENSNDLQGTLQAENKDDLSSKVLQLPPTTAAPTIIIVSHFGDLILDFCIERTSEHVLLKVDSTKLRKESKYFENLLDPVGPWKEGKSIAEQRSVLELEYSAIKDIPDQRLPRLSVSDIGQTSVVKSIKPIVVDFLRILHGYEIATAAKSPPSINIANLAIMADRFDALDSVRRWANGKMNVAPRIVLTVPTYDEEIYRQRLLICLLLNMSQKLATYTSHLILQGSSLWVDDTLRHVQALWWELPRGIEEELQLRRNCILETIASLQNYLIGLYSSKDRICRLGYDTSPQCDSFQLGEFIKFLSRLGMLSLQSPFTEPDPAEGYAGDIRKLLRDMKACPSYQIDEYHSHCGPKKLLAAGLALIEKNLTETGVGICGNCWQTSNTHSWGFVPDKLHQSSRNLFSPASKGPHDHTVAQLFFVGTERDWSLLLR